MHPRGLTHQALILALCLLPLASVCAKPKAIYTEDYYCAIALIDNGQPEKGALLLDSLLRERSHRLYALASANAWIATRQADSARRRLALKALKRDNERWLAYARLECHLGKPQLGIAHLQHYLKARRKQDELRIANDSLLQPCMDLPRWDSIWFKTRYSRRARAESDLYYHTTHGDWGVVEDILDGLTARQQERAGYAYYRALALRGKGEMESALAAAQTAYAKYPKRLEVVSLYADLLLQNRKPNAALRTLRRYRKLDPSNPHILPLLARAKAQKNAHEEAYQLSKKYMGYYPAGINGDLENVHRHIRLCIATQHWAQGLEAIARVIESATTRDRRRLYKARAEILEAIGEYEQAEMDYATARSL